MKRIAFWQVVLGVCCLGTSLVWGRPDRPLTRTDYDPSARQVEFFEALQTEEVQARLLPRDSTGGQLLLTNSTAEPLTVKMPEGFVGVPVHAQFGNMGTGSMMMPGGTGQNNGMAGGNQTGGLQSVGGGTGMQSTMGQQSGMQNGMMPGMNQSSMFPGFFSIPAGRTLRVPYQSACLNHGLNEPYSRAPYRIVPIEDYTSDPVLHDLIVDVATADPNRKKSLQAAIWNVANGIGWKSLAAESVSPIPAPGDHYFSTAQLQQAKAQVTALQARHQADASNATPTGRSSADRQPAAGSRRTAKR